VGNGNHSTKENSMVSKFLSRIVYRRFRGSRRSGRKTGTGRRKAFAQKGMTMIEMIIVMSLIVGLSVVVIGAVVDGQRQSQISQTQIAFGTLESSLTMYQLHAKRYPTSDQGLSALVANPGISGWRGPYIKPAALEDAWGVQVRYESD